MPLDELHVLIGPAVADRGRVVAARRAAARLAAASGDAAVAARVEEELNDAFLRLQLALVAGQAPRVRTERLAIARLAAPALLAELGERAPRRTARAGAALAAPAAPAARPAAALRPAPEAPSLALPA